jgi:transposase, IS30 family
MGHRYSQLSLEERCSIAQWHTAGQSIQKIAAALDRAASTISRELKRKTGIKIGYRPGYAHEQAKAQRWRGSRLVRQPDLQKYVLDRLAMGWSPAQIAGRLALEKVSRQISHESIYRFIYAQIRRSDEGAWRHYLPRAKSKRGHRARLSASPVHTIANRVSIAKRPYHIATRKQPGHWEADLMLFKTYSQNVLTIHERTSRFTIFLHQSNKTAATTLESINSFFAKLPQALCKSITFDNGNEFAFHHHLKPNRGIDTFFCDPHSPWQKGGVENAIGRMRRMLPTKTNLNDLKSSDFLARAQVYNHTPRKCLDFKTPAEVFSKLLLHFKCDSIHLPLRGRVCGESALK